jgi:hypothetical protein
MLQAPADLFDLAQRGGRTRGGAASVGDAELGAADVTADFKLDLEKRLARLLRRGGRAA